MTLPKQILFYSLLLLLTLAVVEGMARAAYYLAYGEWYQVPAPLDPAALNRNSESDRVALPEINDGLNPVNHPYYGFTRPSPIDDLNAMPPPQTGADTVIIAFLGGSVAHLLTADFRRAVEQYFAEQKLPRRPVVLGLAHSGHRQPQQLHVVSYMLTMGGGFDLVVNLDGYNELNGPYRNFSRGVFPFFPAVWEQLNELTIPEIAIAGRILNRRAELAELQQDAASSPFRYSAAYELLHRYRIQRANDRIRQLNYDLTQVETGRQFARHGPRGNFQNFDQVRREAVRVWYRSSAVLGRVAATAGADYYHFLQPSQYIPESKPLSPEELRFAYGETQRQILNYPETYPLLTQYGQELRRDGVNFFDLNGIFRDHPETLYLDRCCHLNARGNELLAAAMVERMSPALLRHGQAAPIPTADSVLAVAAPPPLPALSPNPEPRLGSPSPLSDPGPQFQVSRRYGNFLTYEKDPCDPEHIQPRFFLHITPVSAADLPADRQEHGFANRDFWFQQEGGGLIEGHCSVERSLPDYPIAHIRTGQLNDSGEIWAVELSFPE